MAKRLIGLFFLSIILLSINYVSSQDVYCDDGTTNCIHSDYDSCLSSQEGKTGCWNMWEKIGVTTCQYIEEGIPANYGWKWYSNGYTTPCNSWGEVGTKSCVETSPGTATCLDDCYKLKNEVGNDIEAFCTLTPSPAEQYSELTTGNNFCKNYGVVGEETTNSKCIKCNNGGPIGTYPNQNCETPDITISKLGGNYDSTGKSYSGYAWALINLTDAAKFSLCKTDWKGVVWRSTTSLYNSFADSNYYKNPESGIEEDRYTENGIKTVKVECTGKDGAIKSAKKTIEVDLIADGVCGYANGRGYETKNEIIDTGACSQGNYGQITKVSGKWKWTCSGYDPALNDECSADIIGGALEICGNGILEGTETCDDGNTNSGDGCSSICQLEGSCSFTSAEWSPEGPVEEGTSINMILDGANACVGKDVTFKVYKSETNTLVEGSEKTWIFGGSSAPTWITIGKATGEMLNPKYYFTATESTAGTITSDMLEVSKDISNRIRCVQIRSCKDYTQTECGGDACGVAGKTEISYLDETTKESQKCYQEKDHTCGWVSGVCKNVAVVGITNDGCPGYPDSIGMCVYTDETDDDCDDGFLNVDWKAEWIWATGNEVNKIDPTGEATKCKITEKTQPCPSQVVLSFFTIKNIVLVVAVIILIYLVINIKCRKKKKRK